MFLNLLSRVPKNSVTPVNYIVNSVSKVHDYVATVMPDLEEVGKKKEKPFNWLEYNNKIFPPQSPDEERRPSYVCHMRENIKYSPKKLWYIACLVRGLSVEDAVRQLDHLTKKGALHIKETILEAQKLAVEEHYVEYKTNLWVAESFVSKGLVIKGIRRHAKARMGRVEYKHSHYFVRLEEGTPPENYYFKPPTDKESLLANWMQAMRNRRVINSL